MDNEEHKQHDLKDFFDMIKDAIPTIGKVAEKVDKDRDEDEKEDD
jgi:hypothetical protein